MARGFTPEQLASIDWKTVYQPENHPLKLVMKPDGLYNLTNGELIAKTDPKYRFYWAHDHVHVAPVNWDHRATEAELSGPPGVQVAKPLAGTPPAVIAMLAATYPPQKDTTNAL